MSFLGFKRAKEKDARHLSLSFFAEMKSRTDNSLTASDFIRLALAKAYAGGITDNHRAYERERKSCPREQEDTAEKEEKTTSVVQPPPKVTGQQEAIRPSPAIQTQAPATSSNQPGAKRKAILIEPAPLPPKRGRR